MDRTDLQRLSKDELIELVIRLQRPDKTSRNSSKPPSTDKKEKRENSRPGGAKPGHEPRNRRLADNPDEFRDHGPTHCELCGGSVSPGAAHQTCLAHLARDTAFALEHGSDDLPLRFKPWFGKAFDLARYIVGFKASTIASKKRELEKQLATVLVAATACDLARQSQAKIGRPQEQLLIFRDYPGEVEATNNTSERKPRPRVIQRKVTNGHRAVGRQCRG
jgi:Transposase IS66 family